jgi:hypothetical protein
VLDGFDGFAEVSEADFDGRNLQSGVNSLLRVAVSAGAVQKLGRLEPGLPNETNFCRRPNLTPNYSTAWLPDLS